MRCLGAAIIAMSRAILRDRGEATAGAAQREDGGSGVKSAAAGQRVDVPVPELLVDYPIDLRRKTHAHRRGCVRHGFVKARESVAALFPLRFGAVAYVQGRDEVGRRAVVIGVVRPNGRIIIVVVNVLSMPDNLRHRAVEPRTLIGRVRGGRTVLRGHMPLLG